MTEVPGLQTKRISLLYISHFFKKLTNVSVKEADEIVDRSSKANENLDQMKSYAQEAVAKSEDNVKLADSVKQIVDSYKTE